MQLLDNTNKMCVTYEELVKSGVMGESLYKKYVWEGKLKKHGKGGNGRTILIEFDSLPPKYKAKVIEKYGDPEKAASEKTFMDLIEVTDEIRAFFRDYVFDDGSHITDEKQSLYCNEAAILEALKKVYNETMSVRRRSNKKLPRGFWEDAAKTIAGIAEKYEHKLPASRRIKDRFIAYLTEGFVSIIHGNWGHNNSVKINDKAALSVKG